MDSLKDKKMLLIEKCTEYIRDYIEANIPSEGSFPRHNVFFSYPGTHYQGIIWVESGCGCRYLCIGMKEDDSDRVVHHYYCKGSNSELIACLTLKETADEIYSELEYLKTRVDDLD